MRRELLALLIVLVLALAGFSFYLARLLRVPGAPASATAPVAGSSLPAAASGAPPVEFKVFDYHLEPGKAYELTFSRNVSRSLGKSASFQSTLQGRLALHPVKRAGTSIFVIGKFLFEKADSPLLDFSIAYELGILKFKRAPKPVAKTGENAGAKFKNTLLFEIELSGNVKRVLRAREGLTDAATALCADAFAASLYPLSERILSKQMTEERDDEGKPLMMRYALVDAGAESVRIAGESAPEESEKDQAGEVTVNRRKKFEADWMKQAGHPVRLSWAFETEHASGSEVLMKSGTGLAAQWKPAGTSEFAPADLERYGQPVDLAAFAKAARAEEERFLAFELIEKSADAKIRQSAYLSLKDFAYDKKSRDVLSKCVETSRDLETRAVCYQSLLTHIQDAETRKVLQARATREPDGEIRALIKKALEL